jgi:hypothetical protein
LRMYAMAPVGITELLSPPGCDWVVSALEHCVKSMLKRHVEKK